MKQEINAAVNFLCSYAEHYGSLNEQLIEHLRVKLFETLFQHYQGHWYLNKPMQGQAYRSLEFNKDNHFCDKHVAKICQSLNIEPNRLGIRHELTLWVDPYDVSIRLGSHVCAKNNQQLSVAQFDKRGDKIVEYDFDTLMSSSRVPTVDSLRASPIDSMSLESANNSGASSPQRTSSPYPISQHSMFHNDPLFTPARALSPQAPVFQMPTFSTINGPLAAYPSEQSMDLDPNLQIETGEPQSDRSVEAQSMQHEASNKSSDDGYCGYVESYPYYYKLNRLQKALAFQQSAARPQTTRKFSTPSRRVPRHLHQRQFTTSAPSMNIDQLAPFF